MPILTAQDLRRVLGDKEILDGVSFTIRTGERVGLVGVNGSGKSTLARILVGLDKPDSGTLSYRRGARAAYLSQEPTFPPGLTAHAAAAEGLAAWQNARTRYDEVSRKIDAIDSPAGKSADGGDAATDERATASLLAEQGKAGEDLERLGGWDMSHRVDHLLGKLGISDPTMNVDTMSGGERRRVALARVLVDRPDLAILDEPTNHLDVDTIEWLEEYLVNEYKGALLLITHDRYVLDAVAQRTFEIDRGAVHSYDGGWTAYLEAKADRAVAEARTESNRQNFLRTELEWLRRSPAARSTKQQARVDRAETALASGPKAAAALIAPIVFSAARTGKMIIEAKELRIELGGRTLLAKLDLSVSRRDRIGIVGANGVGKTTLLRALIGELPPTSGQLEVGKNTKFAYFDQLRSGLRDHATIRENVAPNSEQVKIGAIELDVRSYLERFSFPVPRQSQNVGVLSGGERARVALARLLLEPANVLLFDEPTNDLDVTTLSALEDFLTASDAAVICVTHDRYFLDRIATSVLVFEGQGVVTRYEGSYQAARAQRNARQQAVDSKFPIPSMGKAKATTVGVASAHEPRAAKAPGTASGAAKKRLTFSEQHELAALPAQIEVAEKAAADLEAELSDPTVYATRAAELPTMVATLQAARDTIDELMNRWEALELKREDAG